MNSMQNIEIKDVDVFVAMKTHGGSFVCALGHAALLGDSKNREKIKQAFPDTWEKYAAIAVKSKGTV